MLLQIAVRVPDESDPLGLLAAGHRRHLSRLRALVYAGAHLLDPDAPAREKAQGLLREALLFFDRAAGDPFREESELLFPRLLAHSGEDDELRQACQTLASDRDRAAELHAQIAAHGRAVLAGAQDPARVQALSAAAERLEQLYRGHLERLESQVFPRAQSAMADAVRRALAGEMLMTGLATVLPEDEPPVVFGLP
jgi:hypothetical protein